MPIQRNIKAEEKGLRLKSGADVFIHYHLEVQANPQKKFTKKQCYFLHLWEKQDYPMTFL